MQNVIGLFERPTFLFTWCALLLLFAMVTVIVWFAGNLLLTAEQRNRLMLLTGSTLAVFLLAEGLFRLTGYTENYSEARMGHYNFICHGCYVDSLHVWPANDVHEIGDGVQFLYSRTTNSLGLSDREWTKEKPDSVYRIIALGDSFTEGDGAPADSSWPKLLEAQLQKEGKLMEVFNAGVCGSDPFHSYALLKNELQAYRPDLVLVTIAMQDILEDMAVKGGMERFDPTYGRRPKAFELIYAYSHMARLLYNRVLGYSWVLVRDNSEGFKKDMTERVLPELFKAFNDMKASEHGMELVFVLYPHEAQIYNGYDRVLLQAIEDNTARYGIPLVDLLPCYKESISLSGNETAAFWWRNDGHHNSDGYMMMADCIKNEMGL